MNDHKVASSMDTDASLSSDCNSNPKIDKSGHGNQIKNPNSRRTASTSNSQAEITIQHSKLKSNSFCQLDPQTQKETPPDPIASKFHNSFCKRNFALSKEFHNYSTNKAPLCIVFSTASHMDSSWLKFWREMINACSEATLIMEHEIVITRTW